MLSSTKRCLWFRINKVRNWSVSQESRPSSWGCSQMTNGKRREFIRRWTTVLQLYKPHAPGTTFWSISACKSQGLSCFHSTSKNVSQCRSTRDTLRRITFWGRSLVAIKRIWSCAVPRTAASTSGNASQANCSHAWKVTTKLWTQYLGPHR